MTQLRDQGRQDDLADGRTVGLNGFGAFTGFGLSRRGWGAVVGKGLLRLNPFAGGRSGNRSPSRHSTYCLKFRKLIT
jgi:hypothetical protein